MRRVDSAVLAVVFFVGGIGSALADDVKPVEGTFLLGEQTYTLASAVAYETRISGQTVTAVLASDRTIPLDRIKAAIKAGRNGDERLFDAPHVVVFFLPSGEVDHCNIWADETSVRTPGGGVTAEWKASDGRAKGKAKLPTKGQGDFQCSFDFQFDLPFESAAASEPHVKPTVKPSIKPADEPTDEPKVKPVTKPTVKPPAKPPAKPVGPVKMSVAGDFKGNGKPAKLAFVTVQRGEPFSDKPSLKIVFTEKDHSKDKKPDFKAAFGEYGSALILSVHEDGGIFGCEVVHTAHEKRGFSSIGNVKSENFEVGGGKVSGNFKTDGEVDTFGEKWLVDIEFTAPFDESQAKPAPSSPIAADKPPAAMPGKKPSPSKPATTSPANAVKAVDLPLPKDATDIQRKKLVQQITCNSPSAISAIAAELTKSLADQGWSNEGSDLVTPNSAILKRQRGKASLTIMINSGKTGRRLTIFSEGLDWEGTK